MAELRLDSPLQYVKGVGPRKAEVLAHHDLNVVRDILSYYPRRYLDRTSVVPIEQLQVDESATIIGRVKAHGVLFGRRKRYEVILEDDSGAIALLWFAGIKFWERLFKKNQIFAATGTVGYFQGRQMLHPDLERLEDDSDRMIHAGRIIPVYPQTADLSKVGLNSKGMRRITSFIFDNLTEEIPDPLPSQTTKHEGAPMNGADEGVCHPLNSLNLPTLHDAIHWAHYPENPDQIETSRRRLAFDELLIQQFMVFTSKMRKKTAVKKQTINTLKRDAQYFKKKTWYRTAGNRISLLMAKIITSETGKELLKEGTLKLLEGPS